MSVIAILGAGPIGGAIAHRLAQRARVREIRLIDGAGGVAAGKALDIAQCGPVEHFDTRLTSATDPLAAAGASVIVIADESTAGEWEGDRGLALVSQLIRAGLTAPLVFAGPRQAWLMEKAAAELGVARDRLIGTAASAMVGAVRALAALETNGTGTDVSVQVMGRPPAFVIGWSTATIGGSPVADRIPAHRLLAISQTLGKLWPAGPYAIASATAPVVEGLIEGSRRLLPATVILDDELDTRGRAAMVPVEVGSGRVRRRVVPTLSPQERTELISSIERG